MYQRLVTILMFAVCSYTDIRYRRIYTGSLILYSVLAVCGHICGCVLLDGKNEMADMALGLFPGAVCIAVSWMSRQSLGYGDSILVAVCGLSLGMADCLQVLIAAMFLAGLFGLVLMVFFRKNRRYDMPFAPFLLLGMAAVMTGG